MGQRIAEIAIALAGVVALAACALLGRNGVRAARTGPAWKRRVLSAGLFAFATMGLSACDDSGGDDKTVIAQSVSLEQTEAWKELSATWAQAREVADGKRGQYPFTRPGKAKMLHALSRAGERIDALALAGLLDPTEQALLQKERAVLTGTVSGFRTVEEKEGTCYEPAPLAGPTGMKRLADRLPFLEELAGRDKLRGEVVKKILVTIEADVETLGDKEVLDRLTEEQRVKAIELRQKVESHVNHIKEPLEAGS